MGLFNRTILFFSGILMAATFLISCNISTNQELTKFVDPFIGTGGHGHTFPGAMVPFGMVQISPDTRMENWGNNSGSMIGHHALPLVMGCTSKTTSGELPDRGICAHRGAMDTHPENTIAAFKEAVRLGAHMIEFDVRMTKDGYLIVLHDETVDRTTNGKGKISELTFDEVKHLDAGSWKSEKFTGEKIPAFKEALSIMPGNIWLNVHLKGGRTLGEKVALIITDEKRVHQAFLACGSEAARGAKEINQELMICNMERQDDRDEYVKETIRQKSHFIQLLRSRTGQQLDAEIATLKQHHIRINYCCTDSSEEVTALFNSGVDFILTDQLSEMLEVAASVGIEPAGYPDQTNKYTGKQIVKRNK